MNILVGALLFASSLDPSFAQEDTSSQRRKLNVPDGDFVKDSKPNPTVDQAFSHEYDKFEGSLKNIPGISWDAVGQLGAGDYYNVAWHGHEFEILVTNGITHEVIDDGVQVFSGFRLKEDGTYHVVACVSDFSDCNVYGEDNLVSLDLGTKVDEVNIVNDAATAGGEDDGANRKLQSCIPRNGECQPGSDADCCEAESGCLPTPDTENPPFYTHQCYPCFGYCDRYDPCLCDNYYCAPRGDDDNGRDEGICTKRGPPPPPFPTRRPTPSPTSAPADACFSPESTVQLEHHERPVKMTNIKIGDSILTPSGKYEQIHGWADIKRNLPIGKFLSIATDKTTIEVSAEHFAYLYGTSQLVPAAHIKVGDILAGVGQTSHAGTVKNIKTVVRDGAYAPITESGTLVVDGVAASSFATPYEDDDYSPYLKIAGFATPFTFHTLGNLWFTPTRLLCLRAMPSICENNAKNGIGFAEWYTDLTLNRLRIHHFAKSGSNLVQIMTGTAIGAIALFLACVNFVVWFADSWMGWTFVGCVIFVSRGRLIGYGSLKLTTATKKLD